MEEIRNSEIEKAIKEHHRKIAQMGGKAVVEKRGRDYMREIGKRGVAKRREQAKNNYGTNNTGEVTGANE